jgi:hypothetical protein
MVKRKKSERGKASLLTPKQASDNKAVPRLVVSESTSQKKKRKRKLNSLYSKGQVNYAIDSLIHPLYEKDKGFVLVDALLHCINERNIRMSAKKFLRYNMPELLKAVFENID